MERNHYFLIASLPQLRWESEEGLPFFSGEKSTLSKNFYRWILPHLNDWESEQIAILQRRQDFLQIKSWWQKEVYGTSEVIPSSSLFFSLYSLDELKEKITFQEYFPKYFYDFMHRNPSPAQRVHRFFQILLDYFRMEIVWSGELLSGYLSFQRASFLVAAALRSRLQGEDLSLLLEKEDPGCAIISDILMQREHEHYIPPMEYLFIRDLFEKYAEDPEEVRVQWLYHHFSYLEEKKRTLPLFSFEQIVVYTAQLQLLWEKQKRECAGGKKIMQKIFSEEGEETINLKTG